MRWPWTSPLTVMMCTWRRGIASNWHVPLTPHHRCPGSKWAMFQRHRVCVYIHACVRTYICSTMSSCSHIFNHCGRVHGTCCSWSVLVSEVWFGIQLKLLPLLQVGTPLPQLQTHTGAVCHRGCFSYSSNELAVPRLQLEHSGFYVCLATRNGATYSKTCKVTVGGEEAETAWIDVAYILVLIVPW